MRMIDFGIYEKYLIRKAAPISVISIVGKQSGGKSYVMNRLFGTRFNVAASRCTDGIWMSIVEIDSKENGSGNDLDTKIFVVLDCEGLFSIRRSE